MSKESPEESEKLSEAAEESIQAKLKLFQREITHIQEAEMRGSGTVDFIPIPEMRLPEFDPRKLTLDDMALYAKVKNETVTIGELKAYHAETLRRIAELGRERVSTRVMFDAYLAGQVGIIFYSREKKKG